MAGRQYGSGGGRHLPESAATLETRLTIPPPDTALRLAKVVAARLGCSRREAEQYIAQGWVRVDGQVVDTPEHRVRGETVEVDPQAKLQPALPATLLLHKPAGASAADALALLRADTRWPGDAAPQRWTRAHAAGLVALLPLPAAASGLAVFSQARGIVRKLQEEAAFIEQELLADVAGTLAPDGLARLARGLAWNGQPLPPARVSWQSEQRLRFAVKGIPPERVAWMCAQVGLELRALRRIRIGRLPMAQLPAGQWRYLQPAERF